MDSDAHVTEHSASSFPSNIEADLLCVRCGYNLRTLSAESLCPECGMPVRDTLASCADVRWLRAVRRGLTALIGVAAWSIVMGLAHLILVPLLVQMGQMWVYSVLSLSYLLCPLVLMIAALWVTHQADCLPTNLQSLRPSVRMLMIAGQAGILVVSLGTFWPQSGPSSAAWMLMWAVVAPVHAAGTILCLVYLGRLAASLAGRASSWVMVLAATVITLCLMHELIYVQNYRAVAANQFSKYLSSSWYVSVTLASQFGWLALNAALIIFYASLRRTLGCAVAGSRRLLEIPTREGALFRDGG